jgi:hypothetical protein
MIFFSLKMFSNGLGKGFNYVQCVFGGGGGGGICCNGSKSGLKIVVKKVILSHLSIVKT